MMGWRLARAGLAAGSGLWLLAAGTAGAQDRLDGAAPVLPAEVARRATDLVGRGLKAPDAARYGRLRMGRGGIVCGTVETPNRMGQYTGPRAFVADPDAGFAGLVPDAPELRHPASPADYAAMQRTLTLFSAHCAD